MEGAWAFCFSPFMKTRNKNGETSLYCFSPIQETIVGRLMVYAIFPFILAGCQHHCPDVRIPVTWNPVPRGTLSNR